MGRLQKPRTRRDSELSRPEQDLHSRPYIHFPIWVLPNHQQREKHFSSASTDDNICENSPLWPIYVRYEIYVNSPRWPIYVNYEINVKTALVTFYGWSIRTSSRVDAGPPPKSIIAFFFLKCQKQDAAIPLLISFCARIVKNLPNSTAKGKVPTIKIKI